VKIRTTCGFALLLPLLALAAAQQPRTDPRIGNWVEEKVSATYPQGTGLRISVDDVVGGRFRYRISGYQVEGQCDGGKYPYVDANGKPDGRTLSCRVVGPRTVESIGTLPNPDPAATFTLVETVSDDGNTLSGIATYRDAKGEFVREVRRVFRRVP
jgi:hypothetical protein